MLYVAVDIGCIECGEPSAVLGVVTDKGRAEAVRDDHERRQNESWGGQHNFDVFEVAAPDVENQVNYVRV